MPQKTSLFRPQLGWFGDVMPVYVDGTFHLFYTFLHKEDAGAPGVLKGLDWARVVTQDFVHFEERGIAIARGDESEPDLLVGAGSVIQIGGSEFAAYYGGINPKRGQVGEPDQVVLRAFSRDLDTWVKDTDFCLKSSDPYEVNDWRDPSVYREAGLWRMLLCTRVDDGPNDRRGAVALAESEDLQTWNVSKTPFWFPGTTYAPECPEVFRLSGREYLVFSTYSDRFATRHRWRDGGDNAIWQVPKIEALESNDVYAMSTVEADGDRILVGWLSTRSQDADTGHRQWGGDLVAHKLVVREDGSLGTQPLTTVLDQFSGEVTRVRPRAGNWSSEAGLTCSTSSGFAWCELGEVGEKSQLTIDVDLASGAEEYGLAIRASGDCSKAFLVRFEPKFGRFVFDRRPHRIDVPFDWDSDRSYVDAADFDLERPLPVTNGVVTVRVIVDGSAITIYVGDVAMTTRGYDLDAGQYVAYAANGFASFASPRVTVPR